ncbi:DUF397 domain-containing protein [Polymorphospora sp. NPDC051019]|uniref:DUF397 domain-containing protein n=1 Tax=Polymorphospora sp. NPDC051019 TaxID=3155725 RepID=UPI0034273D13
MAETPTPVRWRKSNVSGDGNCVEVAELTGAEIGVRDSKDSAGPVLTFSPAAWGTFLDGVKTGSFDSR